jgi:hypothetical protein
LNLSHPKPCPGCQETGERVKAITLQSLLLDKARERIRDTAYRFCTNATCETVYFPEDHSEAFSKSDLRVRVGFKEKEAPRPLCYCFDHSVEEIEAELQATGSCTIIEDIKDRMKSGCWCETRSPQGRCCLGLVRRSIEAARHPLTGEKIPVSSGVEEEILDCCREGTRPVQKRSSPPDRKDWCASESDPPSTSARRNLRPPQD